MEAANNLITGIEEAHYSNKAYVYLSLFLK